jgi:hypothetical protein
MKYLLGNNSGIALVTSLMLTLISLTIVMYMLTMVTSGIKQSGANKRYKTAIEASYGGTEIVIKEILPTIFTSILANSGTNPSATFPTDNVFFSPNTDACIMRKLTTSSSNWGNLTGCSNSSDAKVNADFTIKLNSTVATETYTVYTKIVDTACSDTRPYPTGKCTGSDLSGYDMLDDGSGTGGGAEFKLKAMPAMYRIEVASEKPNSKETSKISVLYAY